MKKFLQIGLATIVATLLLTGCSKMETQTQASSPNSKINHGADVHVPYVPPKEAIATEEPLNTSSSRAAGRASVLEGRSTAPLLPIYFNFDRSNIRVDQREKLQMNSAYLEEHPGLRLRIEGNCDEKGNNEYNLSLGEKRAISAKKYLINLGIAISRITTISYGDEKPLLYGHDELSWAQNRRDDFVIVK
jgi:peptidoglycan-associated lipoprotein